MIYQAPTSFTDFQHLRLVDVLAEWRGEGNVDPSTTWERYKLDVQARYSRVLDALPDELRLAPMHEVERFEHNETIQVWAAGDGKPSSVTRERLSVLNTVFEFARRQGFIGINPLRHVKSGHRNKDRHHIFWTEEDLVTFRKVAEGMGLSHVAHAVDLMALTGLHIGMATSLKFSAIHENSLSRKARAGATKGLPELPLLPAAKLFIEELKGRYRKVGVDHVLVTKRGNAWGRSNLPKFIKRVCDRANIVHVEDTGSELIVTKKTAMDLPKTWALKLMLAGCSDDDINYLTRWPIDNIRDLRNLGGLGKQKSLDHIEWCADLGAEFSTETRSDL